MPTKQRAIERVEDRFAILSWIGVAIHDNQARNYRSLLNCILRHRF